MADNRANTVRQRLNIEWDPSDPTEHLAMLFMDRLKMMPYHQRRDWLKGALINHIDAFLDTDPQSLPSGMDTTQQLVAIMAQQSGVTLPLRESNPALTKTPYRSPAPRQHAVAAHANQTSPDREAPPETSTPGNDQALAEPDGAKAPAAPLPKERPGTKEAETPDNGEADRTQEPTATGTIAHSSLGNKLRQLT